MRILYVEDHAANLFLLQRIARMGNHEVINYTDGQTALDNFERDKPDLVLMDVQLEGVLSGLDVTKALRAAGHKTPIIAVTAYAMVGDRDRCLEAGCDGYIAKPMPVGELVEVIRRYESQTTAPAPAAGTTAAAPSAGTTAPAPAKPAATGTLTGSPAASPASAQTASPAEVKPAEPASAASAPNTPPAENKPVDGANAGSATTPAANAAQPTAPASDNNQTEATRTGENARDEKVVSSK